MKLTSGYAPPSYLMPCLVVDTEFHSRCRETALKFVDALNLHHAYAFDSDHAPASSEWVVIQQHESEETAITFHVDLVRPFKNGGTKEEWDEGYESYLALYKAHCPETFKKKVGVRA